MIVKHMIGAKARCRKTYEFPKFNMTPTEGAPSMRSKEEIEAAVIGRAEQFAHQRNYTGPGKFESVDYKKALAEISPEERALERGLPPDEDDGQIEPTQRERASRHFAERIKHYEGGGHTKAIAVTLAKAEEGGLKEVRAGLPRHSPWAAEDEQTRRDEVARFSRLTGARPGEVTVKAHAARSGPLSTIEQEKLRTARPTLVRQVAADCLHRGRTQPDHHSWRWVDSWFGANVPPPPPTPGTDGAAALAGYTTAREAFLDEVIEAARALLRDPQAANLLRPTPLGQ